MCDREFTVNSMAIDNVFQRFRILVGLASRGIAAETTRVGMGWGITEIRGLYSCDMIKHQHCWTKTFVDNTK